MLFDRFKKKDVRPGSGSASNLSGQEIVVPDVDDILAEIDQAISKADRLEDIAKTGQIQIRVQQRHNACGC